MIEMTTARLPPPTPSDQQRFCTALMKLPGMLERSKRDLYVTELARQAPGILSAARYDDALHDVWSLVATGQDFPGAIRTLTVIVCTAHPGSPWHAPLQTMAAVLDPVHILEFDERESLVDLLLAVPEPAIVASFRYASAQAGFPALPDLSQLRDVILALESYTVPADLVLPLFRFVDYASHPLRTEQRADLHRWLDKVCGRLGYGEPYVALLCQATDLRQSQASRYYVVLYLSPHPVLAERYLVSAWLQQADGGEFPFDLDTEPVEDQPFTLPQAVNRLSRLATQATAHIHADYEELTVEVVLPRSLINEPVDQWRVGGPLPYNLGAEHPVVVRSLDRLQDRRLHSKWRLKWQQFVRAGHRVDPGAVHVVSADEPKSAEALRAELLLHPVLVLVFGSPPEPITDLGGDAFTAGLLAGVPVMAWCRDAELSGEFLRRLQLILDRTGPAELAREVYQLRLEADDQGLSGPGRVGHHVTLLWDDYDRLPARFGAPALLGPPRQREG